MSFIRRWLGGSGEGGESGRSSAGGGPGGSSERERPGNESEPAPDEADADERAHELELLRAEQSRLDELRQRQLRYADRAWAPPAQGGERRADDGDRQSAGGAE